MTSAASQTSFTVSTSESESDSSPEKDKCEENIEPIEATPSSTTITPRFNGQEESDGESDTYSYTSDNMAKANNNNAGDVPIYPKFYTGQPAAVAAAAAATTETAPTSTNFTLPYTSSPLTNRIIHFQRSTSLRLRADKANAPLHNFQPTLGMIADNNLEAKHVTASLRGFTFHQDRVTAKSEFLATHEILLAGRISPRKRAALNASTTRAPCETIARTFALRQGKPLSKYKTDFNQEKCHWQEPHVAAIDESIRNLKLEDSAVKAAAAAAAAAAVTPYKPSKVTFEVPDVIGDCQENEASDKTPRGCKPADKMDVNAEQNVSNTETTKTSPQTETKPATPAAAPAYNVRPSSLSSSFKSERVISLASPQRSPRSVKATNLPSQQQHYYFKPAQKHSSGVTYGRSNHSYSIHSGNKHPLPVVPESKVTPKTPPVTPDSPATFLEDDLDSLYSFASATSNRSGMSCDHPYIARNGTTFSGRKMKYVVHCSNFAGQVGQDYLTPTQRAQRQIRRLKELLTAARQDLEHKDCELLRLTREVVELRLFKASLNSPEERSASSDAITVRELKTSQDVSPIVDMVDDISKSSPRHLIHHHGQHNQHNVMQISAEMQSSYADSGHFEDMSMHSQTTQELTCSKDEATGMSSDTNSSAGGEPNDTDLQRQELIRMYEQRIEDLIRTQDTVTTEMKRTHNDRVEKLLQKLSESNTRYGDLVPDYEHAKERIRELERQLDDLHRKLADHEQKQKQMYLHMYQTGQVAERIARADQALELAYHAPNQVSISDLLQQLQSTQEELDNIREEEYRNESGSNHALLTAKEAISLWVLGARKTIYRRLLEAQKSRTHVDPEVTLQFLKSAIYYFLTDKENTQGHLQAIESILEFTEAEKQNISKARQPK